MRHDLRSAIRGLLKDRTFTLTVLLTLAICVSATTTMFGTIRSVLLKPLPFPESDRIVLLFNSYPNAGAARAATSVPDYYDRLPSVPALEEQALYRPEGMTYGDENGAERLSAIRATPSFYRLVRARPVLGRLFRDDEGERGRALKVILSHGFWQRKFAGDAGIVGRTIRLNGNAFEVVGVLPREFVFLRNTIDVFVPAPFGPADRSDNNRHSNSWEMLGRLKAGASAVQVQQQVDAVNVRNDERFPEYRKALADARFHTVVVLLQDDVVQDVRTVLYLLLCGVLFVLLIGCVNVANLVAIRFSSRARELATRRAIGGDMLRLSRQILTETTILSVIGGTAGVLAGSWMLRSLAALDFDKLPRGFEVGLDAITVAAILALMLVVSVVLAAAPIAGLRRMDVIGVLQTASRGASPGRRARAVRRSLATLQVAAAFVLLVGAGLLFASFRAVLALDLGFQPDRVVTANINLPATSYRAEPSLVAFAHRSLAAIRALPQVESAGFTTAVPFSGTLSSDIVLGEGHVMQPGESLIAPGQCVVSPGYFETMRIPIASGRAFDDRDSANASHVAIVDERLAHRFWPGKDAVGRRLYTPEDPKDLSRITPETEFLTIVGVAKNVQSADPRLQSDEVGMYYLPYDQAPARSLTFAVRSRVAPAVMFAAIREQVTALDRQMPISRAQRMQDWIDRAFVARRVPMLIASAFGGVALLLSAIGIYGVLAFGVTQRTREIGVRLAIGSTAGGVFRLILREGLAMATTGLIVGAVAAMFVGRVMQAELFGVAAIDPEVMSGVAGMLGAVAAIAVTIPSWRASRVDPVKVLGPG